MSQHLLTPATASSALTVASPLLADQPTVPTMSPPKPESVDEPHTDERYTVSARMPWERHTSPGYHTKLPDGAKVHSTRNALGYALKLLASDDVNLHRRANDTIEAVLELQDTDSTSKTYGIWPWFLEEPLSEMNPPDWNWADFCGSRLAEILVGHEERLLPAIRTKAQSALSHAAWSIFRRNVGSDYTNIAIMGAGVCVVAGELQGDETLITYGRRRLERMIEYTAGKDDFDEYNSPTYTRVALGGCERILKLVKDPESRKFAETLRLFIWRGLADHFHPPTLQWAGPHSRTYSDTMGRAELQLFSSRTGIDFDSPTREMESPTHAFPCPSELIERFQSVPNGETELVSCIMPHEDESHSVYATTWMNDLATLGSVNRETLWTQRRPLIAYWKSGEEVAVLRLRFLKDGCDFASAKVHNGQRGPRVLSAIGLCHDKGDYHLFLDRPESGVFSASDLRLRYELTAPDASIAQTAHGQFELRAGTMKALVHTFPGHFGNRPIVWEAGAGEGQVFLDAICNRGSRLEFNHETVGALVVAAGLELVSDTQTVMAKPVLQGECGSNRLDWPAADLSLPIELLA